MGVAIRWTGPLDWTTGLTFDLILSSFRKLPSNIYDCSHAPLQLCIVAPNSEHNYLWSDNTEL